MHCSNIAAILCLIWYAIIIMFKISYDIIIINKYNLNRYYDLIIEL